MRLVGRGDHQGFTIQCLVNMQLSGQLHENSALGICTQHSATDTGEYAYTEVHDRVMAIKKNKENEACGQVRLH